MELLSLYCEEHPALNLTHKTTNPWEAKTILENDAIDLVFLDIQMPELTGLQLLDLVETKAAVIITNAYAQFTIDGYRRTAGAIQDGSNPQVLHCKCKCHY